MTTTEKDIVDSILEDYRRMMRRGCTYGAIFEELQYHKDWIQTTLEQLHFNTGPVRDGASSCNSMRNMQWRRMTALHEVREREGPVSGVFGNARQYLLLDPDSRLNSELCDCRRLWTHLQHALRNTSPTHTHDLARQTPPTTTSTLTANTLNTSYSIRTPSQVSRVQPDYRRIPLPTHWNISLDCHTRKEASLLKQKGRSFVTKLSIPYRVFIKSKIRNRNHAQSSFNDTSSTISHSSSVSTDSTLTSTAAERLDSLSISPIPTDREERSEYYDHPSPAYRTNLPDFDESSSFREIDHLSSSTMDHCVPDINGPLLSPRSSPMGIRRNGALSLKFAEGKYRPENNGAHRWSCHSETPSPPSSPPRLLGTRPSPSTSDAEDDEIFLAKRRKMNSDSPSYSPSPCSTPRSLAPGDAGLDLTADTSFEDGLVPSSMVLPPNFGDLTDNSNLSSPAISPSPSLVFQASASQKKDGNFRGRYKKDELWPAIEGNYQFLMDGEIIETCKSTESDLSWESDDVATNVTTVSFIEFFQQYKELTDWLHHIQTVTQRQSSSLSEKYLNQTYHEEMLQGSPRRKLFNVYAKQLMRRYPSRKDEVTLRLQHLNKLWEELEKAISPLNGPQDEQTMLNDLEEDLSGLRKWLHEIESRIQPMHVSPDWTTAQLHDKLKEHQVLQRDLQAHSKIVSAILKLCERLQVASNPENGASDKTLLAAGLERRWHAILLQALEWQCRLEEAISNGVKKRPVLQCPTPDSDDSYTGYNSFTSENSSFAYNNGGDHDNSHCRNKNDPDDGVESDNSNFDVIPFSEGEYEKIAVDTDTQTEDNADSDDKGKSASVAIPSRKRHSPERCEGMDHCGTDSALGRSVSDHSISAEQRAAIYHSSIKLSHDKINQAVQKVAATRDTLTMRAAQESMVIPEGSPREQARRPVSLKVESHDVGYSSESHSNEEPECHRYGSEINGNVLQNSNQNHMQLTHQELDHEGNKVQIANLRPAGTKIPDSTWRHSMTSAYDTSSNCSDHNASPDDLEAMSPENSYSGPTNQRSKKLVSDVSTLLSSPNHSFYKMTTIETDSEATSTNDRHIVIDDPKSGAATDAESELSKSLELPYDDTPVRFDTSILTNGSVGSHESSARMRLDAVFEKVEPIESPIGSYIDSPEQVVPQRPNRYQTISDGDQSMDEIDYGLIVESNALFEMDDYAESKSKKSHSLGIQVNPETGDQTVQSTKDMVNQRKSNGAKGRGGDSVSRLMEQAHLLAQDDEFCSLKHSQWYDSPYRQKQKTRKMKKMPQLNQSFNSTDGSVLPTDDSVPSATSACEASCEGTSSSDSEGEFSSTSSGSEAEESGYTNSLYCASKSADNTLCGSPLHSRTFFSGSSSLYRKGPRSKNKKLSRSSDDLVTAQYSVSESAINDIKAKHRNHLEPMLHKLRRTTSDLPALVAQRQSTPRRLRRRRLRRAGSEESGGKLSLSPIKLVHSQSLPASRLHSSRSHSRSLSPSSLQMMQAQSSDCEGLAPIEQEITQVKTIQESTAIPIPGRSALHKLGAVAGLDTDDTDAILPSVNSAAEFSENAWDNLHHIYPNISSDPGEEKLDASDFHKDWDFPQPQTFSENQLSVPSAGSDKNGASGTTEKTKTRTKEKRVSSTKLSAAVSHADDSDSDWEEIHHVIEEARKAIHFTENTLRKFRKDNMETGIFIDPSEYDGPLATSEEHIVCLEELRAVLEAKTGLDPDDDEIRDISELISKWQELGALASERRIQSSSLAIIYQEMVSIKSSLQDITEDLDQDCFDDVDDLEHAIKSLQENRMSLHHEHRHKVAALEESLADFEVKYPDLKMARFDEEVTLLQNRLDMTIEKSESRAADLQTILMSWYDFSETRRELEYLLGQEKRHLGCLDGTEDVVLQLFTLEELQDTMHDLKGLDAELAHYEKKLHSMRTAQSEVAKVYSQVAHREMRSHLDQVEQTFSLLRENCQGLAKKIHAKLSVADSETQAVESKDMATQTRWTPSKQVASVTENKSRSSLCMRLLKVALPIQLALVMGIGLLYLYDPEFFCNNFDRYGLIFNPRLRYVNGPPPT